MKPGSVVADEMFPEGAGPYMDLDEVVKYGNVNPLRNSDQELKEDGYQIARNFSLIPEMKTAYFILIHNNKAGGSSGLLMDLAANEKSVHADFFNDFDDLFDDEDLS